jgi:hypothetical protein
MNAIAIIFAVIFLTVILIALPNMPSSWGNVQEYTTLIYLFVALSFGGVMYYAWKN